MFVPGSIVPEVEHPFAWWARVRNRKTGKERDYYMNGTQATRETVAQHIASHYRNVEVITIDRCTAMPVRPLVPVPPEDYEFGHREAVERILSGEDRPPGAGPKPLAIRPISLKPIRIKPRIPQR